MSFSDPKAFYCPDMRVLQAQFTGFDYTNTDNGIVYPVLTTSGGNVVLSLYKNDLRQAASLVAQGSAALSTTDYATITLTAQNSSGLNGEVLLDDRDQVRGDFGPLLITFTFDNDLEVTEKNIADWAIDDQIEGEGTANCRFVRFHRWGTTKVIQTLTARMVSRVQGDDRNLPNLLTAINLDAAKEAAVGYVLYKLYMNHSNGIDVRVDPDYQKALTYQAVYEREIKNVLLFVDTNEDKKADRAVSSRRARWS